MTFFNICPNSKLPVSEKKAFPHYTELQMISLPFFLEFYKQHYYNCHIYSNQNYEL